MKYGIAKYRLERLYMLIHGIVEPIVPSVLGECGGEQKVGTDGGRISCLMNRGGPLWVRPGKTAWPPINFGVPSKCR